MAGMNKTSTLLIGILSLGLIACGGDDGSGVPDSKVVGMLTADEATAVCTELAGIFPERTVDCGDGITITIGIDSAECGQEQPPATCTATVGDYRDCFAALSDFTDAQICSDTAPPPACAPVFTAGCGGS